MPTLETLLPLAFVIRPIAPLHPALALAQVVAVVALVSVARLPAEGAVAVLLVVPKVTVVLIRVRSRVLPPLSSTVFDSTGKVTNIGSAIFPLIVSKTMWLTSIVIARVGVPIREDVGSFAMLERICPLTLVSVTVLPLVDTEAVDSATSPLANVRVAGGALPSTEAVLDALLPLTIVHLTVWPRQDALSMRFVIEVQADVLNRVLEELVSSSIAPIVLPLTFIDTPILIDERSQAVPLAFFEGALVQSVLRALYVELISLSNLLIVKELADHLILCRFLLFIEDAPCKLVGGKEL